MRNSITHLKNIYHSGRCSSIRVLNHTFTTRNPKHNSITWLLHHILSFDMSHNPSNHHSSKPSSPKVPTSHKAYRNPTSSRLYQATNCHWQALQPCLCRDPRTVFHHARGIHRVFGQAEHRQRRAC